jgi:predicted DNA binding CopG/RHH family protein
MQVLTFVCIMAIQSKSIISGVTPYLQTSMATICSVSTTIIVDKSEDLEFLVLRDNWLVTNRNVNLRLGNDPLVAMKAMSYRAITNKKLIN